MLNMLVVHNSETAKLAAVRELTFDLQNAGIECRMDTTDAVAAQLTNPGNVIPLIALAYTGEAERDSQLAALLEQMSRLKLPYVMILVTAIPEGSMLKSRPLGRRIYPLYSDGDRIIPEIVAWVVKSGLKPRITGDLPDLQTHPLIGRQKQLARARAILAEAGGVRAGLHLFGAPGSGISRLTAEIVQIAVLTGRYTDGVIYVQADEDTTIPVILEQIAAHFGLEYNDLNELANRVLSRLKTANLIIAIDNIEALALYQRERTEWLSKKLMVASPDAGGLFLIMAGSYRHFDTGSVDLPILRMPVFTTGEALQYSAPLLHDDQPDSLLNSDRWRRDFVNACFCRPRVIDLALELLDTLDPPTVLKMLQASPSDAPELSAVTAIWRRPLLSFEVQIARRPVIREALERLAICSAGFERALGVALLGNEVAIRDLIDWRVITSHTIRRTPDRYGSRQRLEFDPAVQHLITPSTDKHALAVHAEMTLRLLRSAIEDLQINTIQHDGLNIKSAFSFFTRSGRYQEAVELAELMDHSFHAGRESKFRVDWARHLIQRLERAPRTTAHDRLLMRAYVLYAVACSQNANLSLGRLRHAQSYLDRAREYHENDTVEYARITFHYGVLARLAARFGNTADNLTAADQMFTSVQSVFLDSGFTVEAAIAAIERSWAQLLLIEYEYECNREISPTDILDRVRTLQQGLIGLPSALRTRREEAGSIAYVQKRLYYSLSQYLIAQCYLKMAQYETDYARFENAASRAQHFLALALDTADRFNAVKFDAMLQVQAMLTRARLYMLQAEWGRALNHPLPAVIDALAHQADFLITARKHIRAGEDSTDSRPNSHVRIYDPALYARLSFQIGLVCDGLAQLSDQHGDYARQTITFMTDALQYFTERSHYREFIIGNVTLAQAYFMCGDHQKGRAMMTTLMNRVGAGTESFPTLFAYLKSALSTWARVTRYNI